MPKERAIPSERLALALQTALGFVLAAVPLALWVAWTPFVFILVLVVGVVSAALLIALLTRGHSAAEDRQGSRGRGPMTVLPVEFIEEIHRIFPLTYHHGRKERARFRGAMEKLRRLLP